MTYKNLSTDQRNAIVSFLLLNSKNGKLQRGGIKKASEHFNVHRNTISLLWKRRNDTATIDNPLGNVESKIKEKSGRKQKINDEEFQVALKKLAPCYKQTIRDVAFALKMAHGTVWLRLQSGSMRRVSSSMKPMLTSKHRIQRLEFALSKIDPVSLLFEEMYDIVMIDEKTFYQNTDKKTFYLARNEELPYRSCQNKRHIGSTMFLSSVAKPR